MNFNKFKTQREKKERKAGREGKGGAIALIVLVVIVALFLSLIGFITDFLWFKELGYVSVFFTKLFTQIKIGAPVFVIVTLLAYIYLKFLKRGYLKKIESNEALNNGRLNLISWGLAAAFGAVATYTSVTRLWFEGLQFIKSTDFDIKDPLYNMDISFYVFKLGFVEEVNQIILALLIAFLAITVIYYGILITMRTPSFFETEEDEEEEEEEEEEYESAEEFKENGGFDNINDMFNSFRGNMGGGSPFDRFVNRGPKPKKKAKPRRELNNQNLHTIITIAEKQLIIVGVLFFLMVGVHFFLKQYELLFGSTGAVYGAGFTDVNVTLWMYRIIMGLSVLAAIGFAVGIKKKSIKPAVIFPIAIVVVCAIGIGAGLLVQNLIVTPDEINKESKYLERNIEYTQYAYDLNNVDMKSFSANLKLEGKDIANNADTISNIRINDYSPAKKFYNQTQSIRQYYDFNDVDVDRYMIDGDYTQTFLSAREIDESKISDTWLNKHLKYTHGYGATLSRVDKITASGQPDMLVSNIPPESDSPEIAIKQPGIYFGEMTNNYALVNTSEDEFDYPDGNSNKYTQYEGNAGIKLNLLNRFMFAVKERSLKLLVSGNIKSSSKILINRNIEKRVKHIMPYLQYENDPYMVTVDGKLYWIIDAYTCSNKYPYSEPYSDNTINYIRNSVKVVIDAYNGDTSYYIVDSNDPIAQTFKNIYPKLFKNLEDMPEGLVAHIRYPNTMLNIQAQVYQRYHMNDVKVFYQNEDLWEISSEIYGTEEQQMEPNYYIMKLPGEKQAEFVNSIPFTPKDKKNMMGLLVARNDGDQYGNLVLYQMPKSKTVYGPMQVEAQIDQNTEISKEFSLWSSAGSNYSRGNMFVIPIEDSILYVEPVYLEATNSSIPEVKRVIVAYGDQIAYESTLADALNSLFGDGSATNSSDSDDSNADSGDKPLTQAEIIEKAQNAYDKAQDALKDGNWAKYGEYMNKLEKYLKQLR
ncbi:MAG: UPF0182 family protein [Eubacterium sp.]|nr:UPF0182 family protein [Candidatus Colimonas fimequi]